MRITLCLVMFAWLFAFFTANSVHEQLAGYLTILDISPYARSKASSNLGYHFSVSNSYYWMARGEVHTEHPILAI